MDFGWETQTERIKRHIRLTSKRKLEILYELNRFVRKYAVKKTHAKKMSIK